MTDTLTYTFSYRSAAGVLWYSCERCTTTVHVAMLTGHVRSHQLWSWRIGQL